MFDVAGEAIRGAIGRYKKSRKHKKNTALKNPLFYGRPDSMLENASPREIFKPKIQCAINEDLPLDFDLPHVQLSLQVNK